MTGISRFPHVAPEQETESMLRARIANLEATNKTLLAELSFARQQNEHILATIMDLYKRAREDHLDHRTRARGDAAVDAVVREQNDPTMHELYSVWKDDKR